MKNYTERESVSNEQMKRWFETGKNVLFLGDHGVGKTTMIRECWDGLGLKSAYFSGSTLDPYLDFIGVPKAVRRGNKFQVEFALPQAMSEDLEAIFIDEFNRTAPAVRNAVLELIQFKSINGRKFPNLKVVWAAANPPDTDNNYDVEQIDPAQEDRFHVILKLSGKPNYDFFSKKYGEEVARGTIKWYDNLAEDLKREVSPRRLDYALEHVLNDGGEARDIFPDERINISEFVNSLRGNKALKRLTDLIKNKDEESLSVFFKSQLSVQPCLREILRDVDLAEKFVQYGDPEIVLGHCAAEESLSLLAFNASKANEDIKSAIDAHRQNHGQEPAWFSAAQKIALSFTAAKSVFVENKDLFTDSKVALRVGSLKPLLPFKSPEEIIDELNVLESPALYDVDAASAKNIFDFFARFDLVDFNKRNAGTPWPTQAISLIYSAFNFFYKKDQNLTGAGFYSKDAAKLAIIPPFRAQSAIGGGGNKGHSHFSPLAPKRGGSNKIREEVL